ncbi:MAG TPA: FAD-binding oxidoreductase [Acetobacteraceae bacterium]|nr:FAD-binding oxidoreductase [Acetobacteraceae bacterium]
MPGPTLIIGGGIVGSCAALFLAPHADVIVLEKDPTYQFASTTLSAASFRQQFSLPVNLHMSRFGADFLEERADRVGLVRRAYLILATAAGEAQLKANRRMQLAEGAKVALFEGPAAIAERFPWLQTADLACATLGLANEGWFDAYSLLRAVREEAIGRGARYIADEATAIDRSGNAVTAVHTAKCERIEAAHVVIAAGRHAGRVAAMAGVPLPIEPRKRTVFVLRAPLDNAGKPLMFDTTGAWIRPEGEGFIGGISPTAENDPDPCEDFNPDIDQLEDLVWPALAHRIPALEQLRMVRAWAGHYDMCLLDHNAVIGPHPDIANLIIAAGFSGHGVQHGPATGRAVSELIRFGRYQTLDLTPLGYERVRDNRPMWELVVY